MTPPLNRLPSRVLVTVSWLAFVALAVMAAAIASGRGVPATDTAFAEVARAGGETSLLAFMKMVSALHDTSRVLTVSLVLIAFLWLRRHATWAALAAMVIPGGMLLNAILKQAVRRPRAPAIFDDVASNTFSFPSGHTMAAFVFYCMLGLYLCAHVRDSRLRIGIGLACGSLVALVGFSRIYLGAHFLSDVVASVFEGTAWVAFCIVVLRDERWRRPINLRASPGGPQA